MKKHQFSGGHRARRDPLAGITKLLEGKEVVYYDGHDIAKAQEIARNADAVIHVVGNGHDDEGEYLLPADGLDKPIGGDRKNTLGLHKDEIELLHKAGPVNPNTAVVLIGGSMIIIEEWKDSVPAILMAYYPGMEGGTAIAQTLFGEVKPSGKLPFVIPKKESDLPQVDWDASSVHYGYYHGYAKLEKEGVEPSVPYEFGLSYTEFRVSNVLLR